MYSGGRCDRPANSRSFQSDPWRTVHETVPPGLQWFRADHLDAARELLDYSLPPSFTGASSAKATAVTQIIGELRRELSLAVSLRRQELAAADADLAAFDAGLDKTAEAQAAVETARSLRRLYGQNWERHLPVTARRLERLVWLDVLEAEDDPVELAKVLERHCPTKAVAR